MGLPRVIREEWTSREEVVCPKPYLLNTKFIEKYQVIPNLVRTHEIQVGIRRTGTVLKRVL